MDLLKNINYSAMNYVDIIVIVIITLSVIFGVFRGFIISVMSLVGWIASIVITYKYAPFFKRFLSSYFHLEVLQIVLSYSSLLIISLIAFAVLNALFAALTLGMRGGFFDRLLGSLFGLFRGALIASFIFMCINFAFTFLSVNDEEEKSDEILPEVIKKAQHYKLLKIGNAILLDFMPSALDKRLQGIADIFIDDATHDKFIGSMIRKMYQNMNDTEISKIEKQIQEKGIEHDEKAIAKIVLDYYKQKDGIQDIDSKNLKRLEEIIEINNEQ